jgi:hypothetical protein
MVVSLFSESKFVSDVVAVSFNLFFDGTLGTFVLEAPFDFFALDVFTEFELSEFLIILFASAFACC